MPADDLFDEFSRFGDRILHGINQDERPARKYKYLLGKINELLSTTHSMVVTRLENIENASRPDEAEAALAELNVEVLEESFRLEGMCDVFDSYGRTLHELAWQSKQEKDSVAPDLGEIEGFAMKLMDREREVANIYTKEIKAIVNLRGMNDNLASLRKRAGQAKKVLTDQMADFAAKAEQFTRLSI